MSLADWGAVAGVGLLVVGVLGAALWVTVQDAREASRLAERYGAALDAIADLAPPLRDVFGEPSPTPWHDDRGFNLTALLAAADDLRASRADEAREARVSVLRSNLAALRLGN